MAQTEAELHSLRGSKYVQSQIGESYRQAKAYLEQGRRILFSGTPCQIAGLQAFLRKEYPHLLTVDILCHGVPSPAVFRKYVDALQVQYGSSPCDIRFRSKATGWKRFSTELIFTNGQRITLGQDLYMDGFLQNLYLRDSCYRCSYAKLSRIGDITLGDFWGYRSVFPRYLLDDDQGISLVMINSEKGNAALNSVRKQLQMVQGNLADAKQGNRILSAPFPKPDLSDDFWCDFSNLSWQELSQKYFPENPKRKNGVVIAKKSPIPFRWRNLAHILVCWIRGIYRKIKGAIR